MAVKTFCCICDKEIGNVSGDEIKKLTGKEICENCGQYLKETRAGIEAKKLDFLDQIAVFKKSATDKYNSTMDSLNKNINRCNSLYTTRQAEIDEVLKNLIK